MVADPNRRWFRYSLRTLFVLVTVIAVALGIGVEGAQRQRRAVERIVEMGGTVYYDYQYDFRDHPEGVIAIFDTNPTSRPQTRRWLGNHFVDTVWHVEAVKREYYVDPPGQFNSFGPNLVQTDFSRNPGLAMDQVGRL